MLEVEHLVAFLDNVIGHALFAQVLLAVFQIIAQRLFGQRGLAVAVGIELVKHEDAGLLQIEYLARLGPDGLADEGGTEAADSLDLEVGILVDFALAVEKLHHAPEAAQLVVGLALHILMDDALDGDAQQLLVGQIDGKPAVQTAVDREGNHPVLNDSVDDGVAREEGVHIVERLTVLVVEALTELVAVGKQLEGKMAQPLGADLQQLLIVRLFAGRELGLGKREEDESAEEGDVGRGHFLPGDNHPCIDSGCFLLLVGAHIHTGSSGAVP